MSESNQQNLEASQEIYLADFMTVYEGLERWGPGSDRDTFKALSLVPFSPQSAIDIGSGKGFATHVLLKNTSAHVVAVDSESSALKQLDRRLSQEGFETRFTTVCASMHELPFESSRFDLIWAEGSAYIIGVERALQLWKSLLREGGCLVMTDLVWLIDEPQAEAKQYWQDQYADMQTVNARIAQIKSLGFEVLHHFTLSEQAWLDYYQPLEARINLLKTSMPSSRALKDLEQEVAFYRQYHREFGYELFVLVGSSY